ncbi:hypothetical protein AF332_05655 [Sporosarcina globispora]|uniref:Uncharacterized protein n=1 Tax=Sporosarcina globispora TaxID=1459 RepID=A0A0M0G9Z5_SPOGL|nr:hypothetical protein AF332_05655 [Sporosarcina globispora]
MFFNLCDGLAYNLEPMAPGARQLSKFKDINSIIARKAHAPLDWFLKQAMEPDSYLIFTA